MTPSIRAAVALAILMLRERMTYRFAGFGTAVDGSRTYPSLFDHSQYPAY